MSPASGPQQQRGRRRAAYSSRRQDERPFFDFAALPRELQLAVLRHLDLQQL